jgi:hypothetical protein
MLHEEKVLMCTISVDATLTIHDPLSLLPICKEKMPHSNFFTHNAPIPCCHLKYLITLEAQVHLQLKTELAPPAYVGPEDGTKKLPWNICTYTTKYYTLWPSVSQVFCKKLHYSIK